MKDSILTLKNRTAVVTGGSRNIGFAIAKKFALSGMNVAVLSISDGSASKASSIINKSGGNSIGIKCDVSDPDSVENALNKVNAHYDSIDVLVNSAGILDMEKIEDIKIKNWKKVLSVNLTGSFLMIQKSIKFLEKSNAPRIINISSNAGRMGGFENGMAYTATKGGVISMTYGIARQLAQRKITVNCIAPGTIDSDMLKARDSHTRKRLLERFPIGRFGNSDEVATAACYFASIESGFTTGSVLDVNGGLFMG